MPNVFAAMQSLRTRHRSFVDALVGDLRSVHIAVEVLDVHKAGYEMRMSVDPEFTADEWRPRLPGDKIPVRDVSRNPKDMSGRTGLASIASWYREMLKKRGESTR